MKLIDFAFKAHFSPVFLPEIPPGNFLFFPEISNFTLRQFLHEISYFTSTVVSFENLTCLIWPCKKLEYDVINDF